MPEWLASVAVQVGGAGALLALGALWLLHLGFWYPASTVTLLQTRIVELTAELDRERVERRKEREEGERRLFNALGVAEKVTRIVERAAAHGRRVA